MKKKCVICGKDGYSYFPFCYEHLRMKNDGKIIKCEKCETWHLADQHCKCHEEKKVLSNENLNNVVIIDENSKSRCITCGKHTDGLLFCSICYNKYKNKELLFKITNCVNVELLDDSYEGRYTSKDGHILKSKAERDIDNYLFDNNISHVYERELPYGADPKEVLHPDFYLPDYLGKGKHVYIEHWGYNENNIKYTETKKFKMPIYERLCKEDGITLICTYEKTDSGKIDSVLERKLKKSNIKEGEINYPD